MKAHARIGAGITLAVILVLGLAAPAAAVTYTNPHVHTGTMNVFVPASSISAGFNLAAVCQQSTSFTFSGGASGTYTGTTNLTQDGSIGGTPMVLELTLTHSGTYGSGSPMAVAGTGTATAVFRTRTGPCTHDGVDDCTITMSAIALTGSLDDHGHGINALTGGHVPGGDNLAMAGGNTDGDNRVTGPSCHFFLTLLDGGHTDLTGLVWDDF